MGCQGGEDNPGPELGFGAGPETRSPAAKDAAPGRVRADLEKGSPAVPVGAGRLSVQRIKAKEHERTNSKQIAVGL